MAVRLYISTPTTDCIFTHCIFRHKYEPFSITMTSPCHHIGRAVYMISPLTIYPMNYITIPYTTAPLLFHLLQPHRSPTVPRLATPKSPATLSYASTQSNPIIPLSPPPVMLLPVTSTLINPRPLVIASLHRNPSYTTLTLHPFPHNDLRHVIKCLSQSCCFAPDNVIVGSFKAKYLNP